MAKVEPVQYDKRELGSIKRAFKAMDDEAIDQAKKTSSALAQFAADRIKVAAYGRAVSAEGVRRVAEGVRVSKSSKIGEFSYGYASQRFSGGATTKDLWPGLEFGSSVRLRKDGSVRRLNQFPQYSGRYGKGSRGWFIYPTLRKIQPEIIGQWEEAFLRILRKWDN